MHGTLYITGDAAADELVNSNGTALLIGMLLDQQVPMEVAFQGPAKLRDRLGHVDAAKIAAMDEDDFVAVCCERPAIHRFCGVMGRRVHALCRILVDDYGGTGERVWSDVTSGAELYARVRALPGFGDEKAKIFVSLLGKRMAVGPDGWREAAGKFGDDTPRSAADSTSPETLAAVRDWKRTQKSARLDKQDRPLH